MNLSTIKLILLFVAMPLIMRGQTAITGTVLDARSKSPVPFATIKFGDSGHGMVAGLDGRFEIVASELNNITWIGISCLGYISQKINLPLEHPDIYLQPEDKYLEEVVIKPPYDKIRRILNKAIANKDKNNPDKYDWYRCHVYYKMLIDATAPDSILNDTSKDGRETADFLTNQHLLMSETYSIRTWKKPQHLQEDVLASRFSGLKKSVFTGLVTDVLPFHSYSDYITLNGKDYHNPLSKGYERYYKFNLVDELVQGADTTWALSFSPGGHNANDLKGTVFIHSAGYAISDITAKARDTVLKLDVRIEQEYGRVRLNDSESRWFPKHLNYIIDWTQRSDKTEMTIHMKGNSRIDSVTWEEDSNFHFDKAHTVKLAPGAAQLTDSAWKSTRPEPLDKKETRTYKVIDSLGEKIHADRYMEYLSKLPEGKVPIGFVDMDIKRLFSYNQYENVRLGLGLQTNERVIKWLSVGGWGGYGFNDKQWKYGAFAEVYADKEKEFVFRASYTDDINDPGRVHLNHDLDKNYFNYYLLQRVDETKTTTLSVRKRINYWNVELAARQQQIIPKYNYSLNYENEHLTKFNANEATLTLRYAYAERTAPMFDHYYSLGSKYPVWYGKLTSGILGSDQDAKVQIPYTQALSAVVWHKHINRLGFEHFMVEGGKSWSNNTLPLSKLFAGNGFEYGKNGGFNSSLYTFGGMMTFYPYQYYSDQFVNVIIRHDFDWKLYKVVLTKLMSSAPFISLQYNMLYGTMAHRELQNQVTFSVPDNGYHEAGLMLNSLVRYVYFNAYYLTLNVGYFYHIAPVATRYADGNGRIAYGVGFEF